jgi:hypothetical protein
MSRKKKKPMQRATEPLSPPLSETIVAPSIDRVETPSADAQSGVSEFARDEEPKVPPASPSKLEAVLLSGTVLSETTHRIMCGLMEFTYEQQERNVGGLKRLLMCRTPQDFAEFRRDLVRDSVESFLACGRLMLHSN